MNKNRHTLQGRIVPGLKVERTVSSATIGSCIMIMYVESVNSEAETAVVVSPCREVKYTVDLSSLVPWPTWDHQRPGSELEEQRKQNLRDLKWL